MISQSDLVEIHKDANREIKNIDFIVNFSRLKQYKHAKFKKYNSMDSEEIAKLLQNENTIGFYFENSNLENSINGVINCSKIDKYKTSNLYIEIYNKTDTTTSYINDLKTICEIFNLNTEIISSNKSLSLMKTQTSSQIQRTNIIKTEKSLKKPQDSIKPTNTG